MKSKRSSELLAMSAGELLLWCQDLQIDRDTLEAQLAEAQALSERLKQEAQIHAQEARTANATIAEIYQAISGKTGEPGNWNGARPVVEYIRESEARVNELEFSLLQCRERYRDTHATLSSMTACATAAENDAVELANIVMSKCEEGSPEFEKAYVTKALIGGPVLVENIDAAIDAARSQNKDGA